ncbi:MAG: SpoIIE family protein phosphatase [bacterium]
MIRNFLNNLSGSRKLEYAVSFSAVLFLLKLVFPVSNSALIIIVSDVVVYLSIFFWVLYLGVFLKQRIYTPLSIILNVGILTALIFFIIAISTSFGSDIEKAELPEGFISAIFSLLLAFIFIGILTYIFSALRELFFFRQKKDPKAYFNTMAIFFSLAFFSTTLIRIDPEYDYVQNTFFVVSILLLAINSLRLAWIAYLTKKQKILLMVTSIILVVLFVFNLIFSSGNNSIMLIITAFSPGLQMFMNLCMIYGLIFFSVTFFTALFHLPTAEAFDRRTEEISSLQDLSKLVTQVFDFKELGDTITTITKKVCNSDSSWLVIINRDGYSINSVNNIGYLQADEVTKLLINEKKLSDKLETFEDVSQWGSDSKNQANIKSLAAAPLKVHGNMKGYLFTSRNSVFNYDLDDRKTIEAYADYAAVAMENAKLIEESIEKERLEKELDVAREIQRKILPSKTPELDKLSICPTFIPAFEVGGDYYDFFEIAKDKLGFVIADVAGKGISAAFIMAEVKGIFETLSKLISSPRQLLIQANEILKGSLEKKSFVTAIYGIIDTKSGVVQIARAGHPPVFHLHKGEIHSLSPEGIGLGLDYGDIFSNNLKELEIKLNFGDVLCVYTDGIPESQNIDLGEFGYSRMKEIILQKSDKEVGEISNEILKQVSVFSQNKSQHDDITLILFKWNFNNNSSGEV